MIDARTDGSTKETTNVIADWDAAVGCGGSNDQLANFPNGT